MMPAPIGLARGARDGALAATVALAAARAAVHGDWAIALAAAATAALWISVRRINALAALVASGGSGAVERVAAAGCRAAPSVAIPILAVALVWRVSDASVALVLVGVWTLVATVDLDRLTMRFPAHSPVSTQLDVLRRHAAILIAILAVSGVVAWVVASVRIGLDLPALILIAALVTVALSRIVRSFGERPRDRDE